MSNHRAADTNYAKRVAPTCFLLQVLYGEQSWHQNLYAGQMDQSCASVRTSVFLLLHSFKACCPLTEISSLRSLLCFVSFQMRPPTCRRRGGHQRAARKRAGRSSRPLPQVQLRGSWEVPEWQLHADMWERGRVESSIPNVWRWELGTPHWGTN